MADCPITFEIASAIIADRCAQDGALLARLRQDPRGALEEITGRAVPDEIRIHLHQNDRHNWHVPFTRKESGSVALDDAALDGVVGGVGGVGYAASAAIGALGGALGGTSGGAR